jgi:NAD(P)-dependent dehydrogenase (short-subunit alcohol dehydrogenase family)
LAKELAPRRVNVICPGVIDTPAYAGLDEAQRLAMFASVGGTLPVGRVGQADEVAAGYVLAMENGFMTGAVIDINGGGLL